MIRLQGCLPTQSDNSYFEGDQCSITPANAFSRGFGGTTETLKAGLNVRLPLTPPPARPAAESGLPSVIRVSRPADRTFSGSQPPTMTLDQIVRLTTKPTALTDSLPGGAKNSTSSNPMRANRPISWQRKKPRLVAKRTCFGGFDRVFKICLSARRIHS